MQQSEKIRFVVYTTIFGVLWGAAEMLLGTFLHMVQFPFRGALMASIGAIILCLGRTYTPVRGATVCTGIVALALKMISAGGFKMGPAVGIMIETFLAELVLSLFGTSRLSFTLACMLCALEGVAHFFITNWLTYGRGIFKAYMQVVTGLQKFFGFPDGFWKEVIAFWIIVHFLFGGAAAWVSIKAARRLRKL